MKWIINTLAVIGGIGLVLIILALIPVPEYKVYDCSMAEFHPDYPPDVREQCRKQRKGTIV